MRKISTQMVGLDSEFVELRHMFMTAYPILFNPHVQWVQFDGIKHVNMIIRDQFEAHTNQSRGTTSNPMTIPAVHV